MPKRLCGALFAAFVLVLPSAASAQTPLSEILIKLLQEGVVLNAGNHQAHFTESNTKDAPYIFNQEIVTQFATFPTGSSSGGFSYTRDPTLGTIKRSTDSFGPSFSERALTAGKGTVTFGMNFQYSSYDHFNSIDMQTGDLVFYLRHQPIAGDPSFAYDLIEADVKLKLSTSTTSFFLNYGLTDRLDVSVTVPLVHALLDATADATILRLGSGSASTHVFPNGTTQSTFQDGGTATGVGDILVRGKYRFMERPGGGIAVEADVRLPSGDAENLLGTGTTQATFMVIGSETHGKFAPHFNIGYTASGTSDELGDIPNEFNYRGGLEYIVNPSLTLTGDLVGRMLLNADQLALGETVYNYKDSNGAAQTTTFTEFHALTDSLNVVLVGVGGKYNVAGNLLITANVLFPVNWTGVRARITPVFGFEYSFGGKTK